MAVVVVVLVVVAVVLAEVGVSGVMRSDECVVGGLKPQTLNLRPIAVTQELQLILVPFIEATTETIDELLAMVLVYMGQQQLLLLLLLLRATTATTTTTTTTTYDDDDNATTTTTFSSTTTRMPARITMLQARHCN